MFKVINNKNFKDEIFFNKKELGEILNIYGSMVSKGEWKDYAIFINKNVVGFDIYRKATEKPLFQIIKNLKSKIGQKYQLKDQQEERTRANCSQKMSLRQLACDTALHRARKCRRRSRK